MKPIHEGEFNQRVYDLYDEYCHGRIERRDFLKRAAMLGAAAATMASGLLPNYARAQTISFTDARIRAQYVNYASPGGNAERMRAYLAHPAGKGPWPAVVVIHENRGLNPYIEDVARRAAVEGFLALAPDGLTALGGYPGNDDAGRKMQARLDEGKLFTDMLNGAKFLKSHALSSRKLGATGFCWGGEAVNELATLLGADLHAAVPFYGPAPETAKVPQIKAPLLAHLAENDTRVNETYPEYEQALKKAGVRHEIHTYPGTQHGFHNNSTPRYNEAAAKLAWERTIEFFRKNLV